MTRVPGQAAASSSAQSSSAREIVRAAEAPSARESLCLPSPSRGRRQKSTSTASKRLLRARRTRGRQRQQCSAPRPAGAILAEPLLHEAGIPRERLGLAQSYPLLRYGTAEVSA